MLCTPMPQVIITPADVAKGKVVRGRALAASHKNWRTQRDPTGPLQAGANLGRLVLAFGRETRPAVFRRAGIVV
jgi:hypothetical protein